MNGATAQEAQAGAAEGAAAAGEARRLAEVNFDELRREREKSYQAMPWRAGDVDALLLLRKGVVNDGDGVGRTKPKRIRNIQFSMLSGTEMERASELRVANKQLYDIGTRNPVPFGCLDQRLGVSDKVSECHTCGKKLQDCIGHFGHIKLELPVFHIGYYKAIQNVLQSVCKQCGAVLLKEDDRAKFLDKMRSPKLDSIAKGVCRKKVLDACKKVRVCQVCGAVNGTVKKVQGAETLKLMHEKYKVKEYTQDDDVVQIRVGQFRTAQDHNPELDDALVRKTQEQLNPQMVLDLFRRIRDEDLPLLWADPEHSRPENMILTHMLVPPVAIRPSIKMDTQGSNEDDLTGKLQEILDVNIELGNNLRAGMKMKKIQDHWNVLQVRVAQFMNGELPGLPAQVRREIKPIRGLVQRLKGKQGRFRGNLSGKRVDFSGRTVISPDPNLSIHQVGVPVHMARKLTYPEVVNEHNIALLREMICRGPDVHPGANFVRQMDPDNGVNRTVTTDPAAAAASAGKPLAQTDERGGLLRSLHYGRPEKVAAELKIGDIVERHLRDDDVVLFNRQPSLHKMSIMSHRVKVLPGRTLRFNECVCAPYNADFDGDEMNLHVPQTEEARAEADCLMGVRSNLITPRNGEPLITATQDFITAAYLMTSRDRFFTKDKFCQVIVTLGDASEEIELPPPAICYPRRLWTGKQIWDVLLRPNRTSGKWPRVSLETKERAYAGNDADGRCMCPNEGYVIFRDSQLMCGSIGKGVLGGSKSGLFYALIRDYSEEAAAQAMNRMTKVCTRWLTGHGFTIGLEDVTPGADLLANKKSQIGAGYEKCETLISEFNSGTLSARPGCNLEESLESEVSGVLSRVRDTSGTMCMETLPKHNAAFIMATSGSKGSSLNICQMMVCVGQQIVGGKRMPNGFVRRTLPHFPLDAKDPASKGFVANSFFSGLTAPEFFFHTMGGREGLVDTAVKTAETGYMARRLMKALEDLSVRYDGTVRNATNGVVQFKYGDDGLNPSFMEKGDRPVNWARLEAFVKPANPDPEGEALSPAGILHLRHTKYKDWGCILLALGRAEALPRISRDNVYAHFLADLHSVLEGLAERVLSTSRKLGITEAQMAQHKHTLLYGSRKAAREYHREQRELLGSHTAWAERAARPGTPESIAANFICLSNLCRITATQLQVLVCTAVERFMAAETEPGEAVGAIGAQSLGEPGTQMTLKTFHFAGVASMNVTLGVPRIKEIINASKNISTPIITVKLQRDNDERVARIVKARLESTLLGEIVEYVEERYTDQRCMIVVSLATKAIENLHLDIDVHTVKDAIAMHKSLKLKPGQVTTGPMPGQVTVVVNPDHQISAGRASSTVASAGNSKGTGMSSELRKSVPLFFNMQTIKRMLMEVIVQGIPSVQRAVVNHDEKDSTRYHLLVEGLGLQAVLGTAGVDGANSQTNHIMEMEEVLGIEAARELVMQEVAYIFGRYGLSIDQRHLKLLADVMSYRGQILGITRFGIAKMKESVLMLASFEKTADHLFDAAVHARKDDVDGVSECIIMGTPMPIGTGMFKLLCEWENTALPPERLKPRDNLLFDDF